MMTLRDRMIVDYPTMQTLALILGKHVVDITLIFFLLAILFEYFGEMNFIRVLKRVFLCFVIMSIFPQLYKLSLNLSFSFSNEIIKTCRGTEFCENFLKLTKSSEEGWFSEKFSYLVKTISDFSSYWVYVCISLIFKSAFIFTIQLYSLVHALVWILYPLISAIGILQYPGEKSFIGLFQGLLWLFLSPIILSLTIALLAGVTEIGMGTGGEIALEGMLHLCILGVFSLASLWLSWQLVKGDGVAAFGGQMAMMGSTVMAMGAVNAATSLTKGYSGAFGETTGVAGSLGSERLKNSISSAAQSSLKGKGVSLDPVSIGKTKTSPFSSSLVPKDSDAYKSMTGKERFLNKVDSVINAKENTSAKVGMIRDFKKLNSFEVPQGFSLDAAKYKGKTRDMNGFNPSSPKNTSSQKEPEQKRNRAPTFHMKNAQGLKPKRPELNTTDSGGRRANNLNSNNKNKAPKRANDQMSI